MLVSDTVFVINFIKYYEDGQKTCNHLSYIKKKINQEINIDFMKLILSWLLKASIRLEMDTNG